LRFHVIGGCGAVMPGIERRWEGLTHMDAKRIDFHVHAKASKRFRFSLHDFWETVSQARRTDLDAFVLTEHFHAPDFWTMYEILCQVMPYEEGVFRANDGFRVLSGAELSIAEGCDLLLLGALDRLGRFSQRLAASPVTGYKPSFAEAIGAAHSCYLMVIGAHMFRPGKELGKLGLAALRRLDALEQNGKDFFQDAAVRAEAALLGLPVVGGSDAHFWPQVGIKASTLPIAEATQDAVTKAVAAGEATVRSLAYGPMAVQISAAYKRLLKARQARAA
jgi:hypothetical protein